MLVGRKNSTEEVNAAISATAAGGGLATIKVDKDGVISAINVSSEKIVISSSRIDLQGYVTVSELEAEIAKIKITDASYVTTAALTTQSLDAHYAEIDSMNLGGNQISLSSFDVVTAVYRKQRYAMAPSGTTSMSFYECTGYDTETIYFLGW